MGVTQTLLYMTCVCLARDLVSCDNFEETGKDITLTPSIRGHPTDILWKHNGNLVLEYDGSEVLKYGSFRGRVEVDFETGELTIRKLKSQDSGQYQSDIVIDGKVQTSTHTVTVLDALLDPQVTCELSESSNASKKLLCWVESQTQPSYEWSGPNINVRSGPELLVDEQEENRDSVYTCTVKNQVNSKSAAFNLKDCPIGRAGSTVPVPVLTVTILLVIFLLLLAILIFIYIRKKKRMRSEERLSKPIEMDPENGEDQKLLERRPTDVMRGSSDATLPSHNRLPHQKESIADKKWEQDNRSENPVEEHNPKQTPQSVSETNQEDKEHGNEGELTKNEKNSESTVEAEEKTEEEEIHKQSQEEEEKESQVMKQGSGNGERSPEHQNESREEQKTGDDNEDNPTPGETIDRRDAGEDKNLLERRPTDVMTGSSDATLPSHNRLPHQKESIADKNWEQDNRSENPVEEHNPKQTPQSVSETNQEDKEHGNEGELTKNEKNSESTVEAEEKSYSKPDETEKEDKSLQSQEEEEIHKQSQEEEEIHKQSQEEEEKESQVMKQGSGNGEKSPEHQNESGEEQKTGDDNEDNPTPGETIDRRDAGPEIENPQSAVTERNNMDTEKEEPLHENEKKSQSDDGEQSPEQQNQIQQRTEDEDDMKPGEQKERNEEEEIDRAEHCNGPAVANPLDGEAPSAPAAPVEEEPLNSSTSSSNPTGLDNHTHQDKEEEKKCSGLDPDEEEMAVTDQKQKDDRKQMAEGKDHDADKSEGKSSDDFDKQADPDCTINSASQQDEAVKSDMSDKDQSCKPTDGDNAKGDEGETEMQTQQEEGGQ